MYIWHVLEISFLAYRRHLILKFCNVLIEEKIEIHVVMLYLIIIIYLILHILAMLWIVSKEPPSPTLDVPTLEDLLLGEGYTGATDKIKWLKTNLAISKEKMELILFYVIT